MELPTESDPVNASTPIPGIVNHHPMTTKSKVRIFEPRVYVTQSFDELEPGSVVEALTNCK